MARFLNKIVVVLEYYVCYLTLPCLMWFPRERGCRKIQHSLSVKPMSQEKNLLCFMKCLPWFLVLIAFCLSFIVNSSFLLVIFFLFSTIKMWSRYLPFHSMKSPSLNDIFGTFPVIQRLKYKKQKAGKSPEPRQLVSFWKSSVHQSVLLWCVWHVNLFAENHKLLSTTFPFCAKHEGINAIFTIREVIASQWSDSESVSPHFNTIRLEKRRVLCKRGGSSIRTQFVVFAVG